MSSASSLRVAVACAASSCACSSSMVLVFSFTSASSSAMRADDSLSLDNSLIHTHKHTCKRTRRKLTWALA